jgi:hypothetical protein
MARLGGTLGRAERRGGGLRDQAPYGLPMLPMASAWVAAVAGAQTPVLLCGTSGVGR